MPKSIQLNCSYQIEKFIPKPDILEYLVKTDTNNQHNLQYFCFQFQAYKLKGTEVHRNASKGNIGN
jgi:hypothetical protein